MRGAKESGTNFITACPLDDPTTKDTTSKCTQPQYTQILKMNQPPRSTYRSEAHKQLSKQTAQEAHTTKEAIGKEPSSEQTRTVASLCLRKPWRRTLRPSLEPLYLEATTLPTQASTRTLSISETRSTLPSDEHRADPTAQGAQAGQEAQMTPMGDHPDQQPYPPLISFLSTPSETLNQLEYPP